MFQLVTIFTLLCVATSKKHKWSYNLDLPLTHIPYYFNSHPEIADQCDKDHKCPFKIHLHKNVCWGYEDDCKEDRRYSHLQCPGDHRGWVKSKAEQLSTFFTQGDFGYIKEKKESIKPLCVPQKKGDSSLQCADHLEMCLGKNIMLDLREFNRTDNIQYQPDVLSAGQIGGHCKLDSASLNSMGDFSGSLQSWWNEMRHFTNYSFRPIQDGRCDVTITGRVYIMKLDATVNMYHHFCDFFNLYATLHANNVRPDAFSKDVRVILWANFPYISSFKDTWGAFTEHPVQILKDYAGKRVCFRDVVFPLLPRMIFGLFYNTPLVHGCKNSGLFDAFTKFVLHRLRIKERSTTESSAIRVTLLSRQSKYRNILNEDQLLEAVKNNSKYSVNKVIYRWGSDFRGQMQSSHNSDIFIGIHGAGLTHALFLPPWAVLFEIYNCNDEHCYKDLARLAGLEYITWENSSKLYPEDQGNHPTIGAHEKFTNYEFDVDEFVRLVDKAASMVQSHPEWQRLHPRWRHDEL